MPKVSVAWRMNREAMNAFWSAWPPVTFTESNTSAGVSDLNTSRRSLRDSAGTRVWTLIFSESITATAWS